MWLQEAQQVYGITLAPASDLAGQSPMPGETGLAVDIASKVVEREVNQQDYEGFVDDFIRNVGEAP